MLAVTPAGHLRCARGGRRCRGRDGRRVFGNQRSTSEVTDEALALAVEEQVAWLDVVVEEPAVMSTSDAMARLPCQTHNIIDEQTARTRPVHRVL